ncbi:hypothetical protein CEQ90_14880 [Lewinellaceae bacterium SD302]|nr:hypothetical protein CEQ90_14880 [Lewinellaceae bacterium SD302]
MPYWQEIYSAYSTKGRHYHNLAHLEKMFSELDRYPDGLADKQSLSLAIFYHDLVYNPLRKDNEAASARRASELLSTTNIATLLVQQIETQILATKDHRIPSGNTDPDLPVLLDIDLAILGSSEMEYNEYRRNVRKEYRFYPDFLYYPARRKAMRTFLEREHIYHTDCFRDLYGVKARENIKREING